MTMKQTGAGVLWLALLGLGVACSSSDDGKGGGSSGGDPVDTGEPDEDTGDPEVDCRGMVLALSPEDAATGWFYRDSLTVTFEEIPEYEAVRLSLTTDLGDEVPFTVLWNEENGLDAYLSADLVGNAVYTLTASCENEMSATFETDEFGAPMETGATDLIGNVYELDLPNAEFTKPVGVGALLGSYLSSPLLASIQEADEETLTLLVAQGYWDEDRNPHQDMGTGCYDFPPADFTASPFFAADTDYINILYQSGSVEANIPMKDMRLEGTFSPNGDKMGGAWIGGLVDTSDLGPLLDLDAEAGVICEYISAFGLSCADCLGEIDCTVDEDGEPWDEETNPLPDSAECFCLYVEAHFNDAPLVEGMTIDPDPLGESDGG